MSTEEKEEKDDDEKEQEERDAKKAAELNALKNAIREQAREDENPNAPTFTLRRILGGEFLTAAIIRRYIGIICLIAAFTIIYVSNRYSCQKDMQEIDRLEKELKDAKYKALSSSSELTELCRESNVIKMLEHSKDSMLQVAKQPPYIIKIPEK